MIYYIFLKERKHFFGGYLCYSFYFNLLGKIVHNYYDKLSHVGGLREWT